MFSKYFIERPVLASVIAILMVVAGVVALQALPISEYPDVTPPTVQVTTIYPGASAQTVIDTVALPIEQQVNGVEGMIYMQSYGASDGSYTLTVTFTVGTDPNQAQILVQNRVTRALASLPQAVQEQGVTVQKVSTSILEFVALTSPGGRYDSLYLANYAAIHVKDELARLPGVGNVYIYGAGAYAMRVWLDPNKMYARGLSTSDVVQALQQQSEEVTAGQVGMPPAPPRQNFQYTIDVHGRLNDPGAFADIILKQAANGAITRVRDVGRVELGAQSYSQVFRLDGDPAAGIGIFLTPGANALQVEKEVNAKMVVLAHEFPKGLVYSVPFDTTTFIAESVHEVYKTLFEAVLLVLVVILVFLQDWRAMLVPTTTEPVTIIGAFAIMLALGFTVNLSTLFAIVLSIGIVVDDAIVVVEAVSRKIEEGLTPKDAAIEAMGQLFAPIVGITLVLMSVFLPASFLPGLTGRMYAQFALVIAATALLSAISAVTLTPTQSALWLRKPVPMDQRNAFYRGFNAIYDRVERAYVGLISRIVLHSGLMTGVALAIIVVVFFGLSRVPTSLLPIEDQGYLIGAAQLPDGTALGRTEHALDRISALARRNPNIEHVVAISGISALDSNAPLANAGAAYIVLKDWSARGAGGDLRSLLGSLGESFKDVGDARMLVIPPPAIQGIGNTAGATMEVELRDGSSDLGKLQTATDTLVENLGTQSSLQAVQTTFRTSAPQYFVSINRDQVQELHVTLDQVFSTLGDYLGSNYVGQFNKFAHTFDVYVQGDSQFRLQPEDITNLSLRNSDGNVVPLGAVVSVTPTTGPSLLSLYNLYPTATVVGVPAMGVSSGETMNLMEEAAGRTLPRGMGFEWTGMSYQEKIVSGQMYLAFGLALLLVYLVLAGQYESWTMPLAVMLAVPMSLVGPVLVLTALKGVGFSNSLYVQIGLLLVMALSAKNAILIVEMARESLARGASAAEAALDGARARFRAILMTSFAFILGVAPLVVATGASSSARREIGMTAVSGMLASTCLAVLFVPAFFVVIQRLAGRRKPAAAKPGPDPVAAE